jgi:hypothetical protein
MFRRDYLLQILTATNTMEKVSKSTLNQPLTARTEVPKNHVAALGLTPDKQFQNTRRNKRNLSKQHIHFEKKGKSTSPLPTMRPD